MSNEVYDFSLMGLTRSRLPKAVYDKMSKWLKGHKNFITPDIFGYFYYNNLIIEVSGGSGMGNERFQNPYCLAITVFIYHGDRVFNTLTNHSNVFHTFNSYDDFTKIGFIKDLESYSLKIKEIISAYDELFSKPENEMTEIK